MDIATNLHLKISDAPKSYKPGFITLGCTNDGLQIWSESGDELNMNEPTKKESGDILKVYPLNGTLGSIDINSGSYEISSTNDVKINASNDSDILIHSLIIHVIGDRLLLGGFEDGVPLENPLEITLMSSYTPTLLTSIKSFADAKIKGYNVEINNRVIDRHDLAIITINFHHPLRLINGSADYLTISCENTFEDIHNLQCNVVATEVY